MRPNDKARRNVGATRATGKENAISASCLSSSSSWSSSWRSSSLPWSCHLLSSYQCRRDKNVRQRFFNAPPRNFPAARFVRVGGKFNREGAKSRRTEREEFQSEI